jgi:hypothetical protein
MNFSKQRLVGGLVVFSLTAWKVDASISAFVR